ncbi:MAG: SUMF1/EgtB/PvdO family nonheme iron enzyme [Chloroflexota bacterium]
MRGGSWNNNEDNARVAIRNNNHPNNRNNNIGFRVVLLHSFANGLSSMPVACPDQGRASRQNWLTFCPVTQFLGGQIHKIPARSSSHQATVRAGDFID